jgi:hypothetical protein
MKLNKSVLLAFGLLVVIGSLCRVAGFAPQIAMAVFGGAVIKNKKLAIALPLLSMLVSDVIMEGLYNYGYMSYGGFYKGETFFDGQVMNYILLAGLIMIGAWAGSKNWGRIAVATIAAPGVYFLVSNFLVWAGGAGLHRPYSFDGLLMCYGDAVPFFRAALQNTIIFSAILFGGYYLIERFWMQQKQLA